MKATKFLSLLCISVMFWSCSEDDAVIELTQPTFEVTAPVGESGLFTFENTTPNKELFYTFWEFEVGGPKVADKNGPIEYEYTSSGPKTVTLTMVSSSIDLQTSQNITVTLPPPADDRFLFNPENLIANAYFAEGEGDEFTNWNKYNGADRIVEEATNGLISSRAAKISNPSDGNPWDTQFVTDATPTVNGQTYTVSLWIKGDPVEIRYSTNPGVGGDQYAGNYTATAEWSQYFWTFTANSDTTLIALDMGTTGGDFIIDGVELVEGDTPLGLPSNDSALLNGGLEEGDGDDFTNWNKYNGADRVAEEVTDVLSGSRAAKFSNPSDGNPWDTQFVSDGFATVNGASYAVSLWIKGDPVEIRYSTNPGVGGDQYAGNYTATAEWSQYSWTFTANSDTTLLALDIGTTGGDFVIDNIKVVQN